MLFAFASRRALKLLSCLLASVLAAPPGQPCGDNEELTCLGCHEPSCKVPYYYDAACPYYSICKLGCGCKSGYVRYDQSLQCVSAYQCEFKSKNKRFHGAKI
ncbi:uncharacterized protein LOC117792912 [Drosophila innubila]|uniref:uncharacterized protein LOC117792912 n=1 Tax=Drosophila innubila TaxID=198719 RepID=UPI00148B859E|nr:uncharacterized protein LOC117792912 [Drosophila innubila]